MLTSLETRVKFLCLRPNTARSNDIFPTYLKEIIFLD